MDALAHHGQVCSRAQMTWRHDSVAEIWQAICRDAGLSAHTKQVAAEFPPGGGHTVSDVYCRGVMGDLPVHADVVVTSTAHCDHGVYTVCSAGIAVGREERRKIGEWKVRAGASARLVPLSFESQGRWGELAVQELARLARMKGSLQAGSPPEAAAIARASLKRWRRWVAVALQRGNAAMIVASLGQPSPEILDIDLLQAAGDEHVDPIWAFDRPRHATQAGIVPCLVPSSCSAPAQRPPAVQVQRANAQPDLEPCLFPSSCSASAQRSSAVQALSFA